MPGMGTAPPTRQAPAMPDPKRVVNRSLSVATRNGMGTHAALTVIQVIAAMLYDLADAHCPELCTWASDIQLEASQRAKSAASPVTDYEGNAHGDGSGGPAGRTETTG